MVVAQPVGGNVFSGTEEECHCKNENGDAHNAPLNVPESRGTMRLEGGGGEETEEQVPVGRPQLPRHVRRRTIAGANLSKATKGVKLGLHLHDKLTPRG